MIINDNPLITVITPLYNAEKYIAETIENVINQSYRNWEMIVVDDCSTDNSRDIVKEYESKDNRIRLIESELNFGGPARPRNIGIDNANGEYIAFLDADDVWLSEKLEKQVVFLKENKDIDLCYTLSNKIDENSIHIGKFKNQTTRDLLKYFCSNLTILYLSNYININTVLIKTDKNIKFREDKYLVALEDWFYWIENLLLNKKIGVVKESLINYRIDMNSISNRASDIGYRKIFIMYSILLFEKKISFYNFFISSNLNFFKIIYKNLKK